MRTDILFKDFKRSEYIENFVSEKVEALTEHFAIVERDAHIAVRLEKLKERTPVRRPIYQCEIIVKTARSPKIFKTSKSDRNIFRAIASSFQSMRMMLSKSNDRLHRDRRRRRTPEFISLTPPPAAPSTP